MGKIAIAVVALLGLGAMIFWIFAPAESQNRDTKRKIEAPDKRKKLTRSDLSKIIKIKKQKIISSESETQEGAVDTDGITFDFTHALKDATSNKTESPTFSEMKRELQEIIAELREAEPNLAQMTMQQRKNLFTRAMGAYDKALAKASRQGGAAQKELQEMYPELSRLMRLVNSPKMWK